MRRAWINPMKAFAMLRIVAAVALLALLTGCEGLAFLAAMGGDKVPAVYELPNQTTLILVDDPSTQLGDPALRSVVATNAAYHLKQNKALDASIVPQEELSLLMAREGQQFAKMPVDQIGRLLQAQQVVHVVVESVVLEVAPGVYRPTAMAQVKVIDASTGQRLFPAAEPFDTALSTPPGYSVRVRLSVDTARVGDSGATVMLRRELAQRLGLTVAQLFYKHSKPQPGGKL